MQGTSKVIPGQGFLLNMPEDVEHGVDGAAAGEKMPRTATESSPTTPGSPPARPVAAMRNLYTAALAYNGYTITDGALRLIVLLHAADLGYVKRVHSSASHLLQHSSLPHPIAVCLYRAVVSVEMLLSYCCRTAVYGTTAVLISAYNGAAVCVLSFLQVQRHRNRLHV